MSKKSWKDNLKKLLLRQNKIQRIYVRKESGTRRKMYQLKIQDMKNIIRFLEGISPYLILKKKQAEILIKFCQSRINLYKGRGRKAPYVEDEFLWYEKIRKLNTRGIQNEKILNMF